MLSTNSHRPTRRDKTVLSRRIGRCELNIRYYAMLVWYLLSFCVRLSVRPSVTSRYCIETTARIELDFKKFRQVNRVVNKTHRR